MGVCLLFVIPKGYFGRKVRRKSLGDMKVPAKWYLRSCTDRALSIPTSQN